jgi:type IV pilus assembly protein PilF
MNAWVKVSFVALFLSGCVTVTELESGSNFDSVAAADARIALGLEHLERKNMRKARQNLELAIKYAPNYYRSLNSIAYYYQQVGDIELATKAYKKALRESPRNGDVLNNYATFLCQQGQFKDAQALFKRAIEQPSYSQVADSYENAALCSLMSQDTVNAEYYFQRSLDHDPGRYIASLQYARLAADRGEYDQARARLIEFYNRYGYTQDSLNLLIIIEQGVGNHSLATKYSSMLEMQNPYAKQ